VAETSPLKPSDQPFPSAGVRVAVAFLTAQQQLENAKAADAVANAAPARPGLGAKFLDALTDYGVLKKREDGTYGLNR
jgi:hypothetical protein